MIIIQHNSIPEYLSSIRLNVQLYGKNALIPYEEYKTLRLGFQCSGKIHVIGINIIRNYYNIERILPDIPGLVKIDNNPYSKISQTEGIRLFVSDYQKALEG